MKIDKVDAEILNELAKNPRNISTVARNLGLPTETVRYRVKRLLSQGVIKLFGVPNHLKLGLDLFRLILRAKFDKELEKELDNHPYVSYVARCYGCINGYIVNLLVPRGHDYYVEEYLEKLRSYYPISDIIALKSLPTHYQLPNFHRYYNFVTNTWDYSWKLSPSYIRNIEVRVALPQQVLLDHVDIAIIQELQVDATVSLTSLASKLGLSVASLRYHFVNHVIDRNLVNYAVGYMPYPGLPLSLLIITFSKPNYTYGLYELLRGLPPIVGMALTTDISRLVALIQAPLDRKIGLYEALKYLMDDDIIKDYFEVIIDRKYVRKYTIPDAKYYKAGKWILISEAVKVAKARI